YGWFLATAGASLSLPLRSGEYSGSLACPQPPLRLMEGVPLKLWARYDTTPDLLRSEKPAGRPPFPHCLDPCRNEHGGGCRLFIEPLFLPDFPRNAANRSKPALFAVERRCQDSASAADRTESGSKGTCGEKET